MLWKNVQHMYFAKFPFMTYLYVMIGDISNKINTCEDRSWSLKQPKTQEYPQITHDRYIEVVSIGKYL